MPAGRPRKAEIKRHPLNMRTTKDVRERLEAAAGAAGRSLAQEVEFRLERSFHADDLLGGSEAADLGRRMAVAFGHALTDSADLDPVARYAIGMVEVLDALVKAHPYPDQLDLDLICGSLKGRRESRRLMRQQFKRREPANG